MRRTAHGRTEEEAIEDAYWIFASLYPVLMVTGKVKFLEAMVKCIEVRRELGRIKSDKTANDYTKLVKRSFADIPDVPVDEVTKGWLEKRYASLHATGGKHSKGVSVKTLRKLNVVIKGSYDFMIDQGAFMVNPAYHVKYPKATDTEENPPRTFTETERSAFQDALEAALNQDADNALDVKRRSAYFGSMIALSTGMRRGEVCALRRGDVRIVDGLIRVERTMTDDGTLKPPKTKAGMRTLAMPNKLKQAVIEHYEWQASFLTDKQRRSDSTPLCCDVHGNAIRPRYMADQFKRLCKESGIELEDGKSFHVLRHTFVSQQVASGVDIKSVQAYVGHASVSTTLDIYAHLMPGHGVAIASVSDELFGRARKAGDFR